MIDLLLIIDMQQGFRYKESESILEKILELKTIFKGNIIFSKFVNENNSIFEKQLNWIKFQNKEDRELFCELESSENLVFEHNSYTVFNDYLKNFIFKNKINKVYLCGVYTDVCIIKTAMDLFDENIKVFIVEDACNSPNGEMNHIMAIDSLKHILGKGHILTVDNFKE